VTQRKKERERESTIGEEILSIEARASERERKEKHTQTRRVKVGEGCVSVCLCVYTSSADESVTYSELVLLFPNKEVNWQTMAP